MLHLSAERIAALNDEPPTSAELDHLSRCAACAREAASFRSLSQLAKSAPMIGHPFSSWERLAPALKAEGLIREIPRRAPAAAPARPRSARRWMQAAAAVMLLAGGVAAGRISAGVSVLPAIVMTTATADAVADRPEFGSVPQAQEALAQATEVMQWASAYLADADQSMPATPGAYRARATALAAMATASNVAPDDPVITTLMRPVSSLYESTVRQYNIALPTSLSMIVH